MPYSADHNAISQTVGAMRSGHNPDGRKPSGAKLDLPPDLFSRMMRGEITAHQAREEWNAREPAQSSFNAEIRRRAGVGGYVADAAVALDPTVDKPAIRDPSSGQFVDLNAEARAATGLQATGGIVPTESPAAPPDPNQGIRDAYAAAVARRAT